MLHDNMADSGDQLQALVFREGFGSTGKFGGQFLGHFCIFYIHNCGSHQNKEIGILDTLVLSEIYLGLLRLPV
jgi:hypothetical protein